MEEDGVNKRRGKRRHKPNWEEGPLFLLLAKRWRGLAEDKGTDWQPNGAALPPHA